MTEELAFLACAVVIVGAACGAALALYAIAPAYLGAVTSLAHQAGILP